MKLRSNSITGALGGTLLLASLTALLAACTGSVETGAGGGQSGSSGTGVSTGSSSGTGLPHPPTSIDKIDVVMMIDNSRSMADKQQILAESVPDLVQRLVNPACVDAGGTPVLMQPAGPLEPCPAGSQRPFPPVLDMHLGVISSSLGGHGSDSCQTTETQSCSGKPNPSNNDGGHLVARQDPCTDGAIPTYQNKGFLAWDPAQKLNPPGEAQAGSLQSMTGLVPTFRDLVLGLGQVGCGYESQLESWYRFLVDPDPYQTITVQGGKATAMGTDTVLLQQRAEFLRPSSLLVLVMLTDENDCSVKEYGQFYFANQQRNPADTKKAFHLPRARQECAKNPNDPCCKSCGQAAQNCPVDPMCTTSPMLSDLEDDINLRCFDQKRRFGIDFLYSIDRYTAALQSATVPNRQGDLVQNPLFSDLNPADADSAVRDSTMILVAGIVGVPWQDVARDPADLKKGFLNGNELAAADPSGHTRWDYILGNPENYVAALDPHMVESSYPRSGTNPITGTSLAPPGSVPGADPLNGHEYTIKQQDDLEYACVFPLPMPRDCSSGQIVSCDCKDPTSDNPLCDPMSPQIQVGAKGYPGLRELSLLKTLGPQAITTSICPAQLSDPSQPDYGYRPAMAAITQAVNARLKPVVN